MTQGRPGRVRRVARVAGAAVLLLAGVLAVALGVGTFVVRHADFQRQLAGRLSTALGREVRFGSVNVELWHGLGVRLSDVELRDAQGSVVTIETARCTVALLPLLRGGVVVEAVWLERPRLELERSREGGLRLLAGSAAAAAGEDPDAAAEVPGATPVLPRLRIRDGSLDIVDRKVRGGPLTLRLEDLVVDLEPPDSGGVSAYRISLRVGADGTLTVGGKVERHAGGEEARLEIHARGKALAAASLLPYLLPARPVLGAEGSIDATASLSGRVSGALHGKLDATLTAGSFEWAGLHVEAPVHYTSSLSVRDGKVAVQDARVEASRIGVGRLAGTDVRAAFDFADHRLELSELHAGGYGGVWRGKGSVLFRGAPAFSVSLDAEQVHAHELFAILGGEGRNFESFEGAAQLQGRWTGADTWAETLEGTGQVLLRGGALASSTILGAVWRSLLGRIPLLSMKKGALGQATKLIALRQTVTLADSLATTHDLELETDAFDLKAQGTIAFTGALDLRGHVALTAVGVQRMIASAALPASHAPAHLPAIPLRIDGTLADPNIETEMSQVPLGVLRRVFRRAPRE